jgi:leucyl-tRNA synthetase
VDEDHAILHVHFHLFRQAALFDKGLRYPNAAGVANGDQGRFHFVNVATL